MRSPGTALPVADDHAVRQRVKSVLHAEHGEEFHSRPVSPLRHRPGSIHIRTGKIRARRVPDTRRLAHLHPDMGIVPAAPAAGAAVPSPVVPGQRLVHRAILPVDEPVDAGTPMRRAVPGTDERGSPGLGAAHGMEHQPLHRDLPPRRVTGVPCQETLHNPHAHSSPFPSSARPWSCARTSFSFSGTGSPRCTAFSTRLTPSLEI